MATNEYASYKAKCPFYKGSRMKTKELRCQGIFDKGTVTSKFRGKKDMHLQYSLFCCSDYKDCEIARAIMEAQYPDEEL